MRWKVAADSTFCMAFWHKAVCPISVTRALTAGREGGGGSKYPRVNAVMKALCRQQRGSCGSERVPTNLCVHLYTRVLSDVNSVSRHTTAHRWYELQSTPTGGTFHRRAWRVYYLVTARFPKLHGKFRRGETRVCPPGGLDFVSLAY